MKHLLLFASLLSCFVFISHAQLKSFTFARGASIIANESHEDWNPVLQENEEVGDEFQHNDQLNLLKQQLEQRLHPSPKESSRTEKKSSDVRDVIDTPYVWRGLQGNTYNGSVPNDNDIAVSNTGYLVSVMNTNIFRYDLNNDSSLGVITLGVFSLPLGNLQSKYDPKVIYDPDENKFVLVFLAGTSSAATNIIVAFSQTDDPAGTWNLYELPGNPLNDSLWSDFPAVALTNHELFLTVNHLADNETWQVGWRRTVIWQVNKFNGYNGDSLHTQLHYEIGFGGKGIRNLCPAKGGSHLYGADMYFLSERNLDIANDTFFLVHVTDTINAPSQMLTEQALVSDVPYYVPITAKQPYTSGLATNDSRVLAAFYENDRIQFVGNTTDTITATAAVYHGVITNVASSPSVALNIISDDTVCYGYPNISYLGNNSTDNMAVIDVLQSSVNLYPGYGALVTDGNGSYSPLKNVKDGLSYHFAFNGTQRWGDYTGSQRDYGAPGKVWVNGSYALLNHKTSTWLAQLSLSPPPANVPVVNSPSRNLNLYPNPSQQNITLQFEVADYAVCNFEIYDVQGKLVKLLMNEKVSPGNNLFGFSTAPLTAGEYLLRISAGGKVITSEKFVKQ